MAGLHKSDVANPVLNWIDSRLPIFTMLQKEYGVFPTPRNFNYLWNFGALAMVNLVIMIATGIFLAMNYTPHATMAFDSVERILRDVNFGWLLRYVHANGASMFFIVVYIHIAHNAFDRVERHAGVRCVVHRQEDAGGDHDHQIDHRQGAEIPEIIEIARGWENPVLFLNHREDRQPLIDPIDHRVGEVALVQAGHIDVLRRRRSRVVSRSVISRS